MADRTLGIALSVFIGVGLVLAAAGLFDLQRTRGFLAEAREAPGRVVGLTAKGAPIFAFRPFGDDEIEVTSSLAEQPPSYAAGDRVIVVFDPQDPRQAEIKTFLRLWFLSLLLLGLGGFFLGLSGLILLVSRKMGK
ncbi:MAG: DUF3592 domain-containing protein [Thermodesulfobacteriota bacterium]